MKQKKKKTFLEYKNMPGEKTLEITIKALEKALEKPRLHPAKAYNRKQKLDIDLADPLHRIHEERNTGAVIEGFS